MFIAEKSSRYLYKQHCTAVVYINTYQDNDGLFTVTLVNT